MKSLWHLYIPTLTTGRLLRISAPVLAVCTLSLLSYQPHARNAGDLLIGSWAVLTAIYSVAWRTLPWRYRAERTEISPWLRRMVLCQLSIIYLASAAHKLAAPDWRDGAAVGFALRHRAEGFADFTGASVYRTALLDVSAEGACFRGANLDKFRVVKAERGSSMPRADFRGATMKASNFRGVDLAGADLRDGNC